MSLILPPRLEGSAADAATTIEIPIYEAEHLDSLRPTWLPVDPSTYRPPPKRSRRSKLAGAARIGLLLFVTFGLAFSSVVAPHFAREYVAKRAAAASSAKAAALNAPENHAYPTTPGEAKPADAVTLTVDVMNLPVSKDFPQPRKAKRRAAGS